MGRQINYTDMRGAPTFTPTIVSNGYTTIASDLFKALSVNAGPGDVTVTLLSAVTAGDGALQIIMKGDTAPTNLAITGAADNGSGLIRLTLADTSTLTTGAIHRIRNVSGTVEANGSFPVTVIDGTHVDLQGSTFTNAFATSRGAVLMGGRVIVTDGASQLAWLSQQSDIVFLRSNGASWIATDWQIKPFYDVGNLPGANSVTVPPLISFGDLLHCGQGGGAASGRRGAASSACAGGGGGGGGYWHRRLISAAEIVTSTISFTNGSTGGQGGAAQTVDSNNGNFGFIGQDSTFGSFSKARGGERGNSGTAAASTAMTLNAYGTYGQPGIGAASNIGAAASAGAGGISGGGGAGGSVSAANVTQAASVGGVGSTPANAAINGGSAGVSGGASAGVGGAASDFSNHYGGAGGGGGAFNPGAAGQDGARGGFPGGAGGGGGAANNGFAPGVGGAGESGHTRILWIF